MNFIVEDKVKDLGVKILGLKIEGIDNNKSNIGIGFAIPINEAKSLIKASLK